MTNQAILALEDGSVFYGAALGKKGSTVGEVVFNTAMTGYQEILSDPSYAKQLITFTYPHIGNTGVNLLDQESDGVYAAGVILRSLSCHHSNWRAEQSLESYLITHHLVGIADIDTRRLTQILRDKGSLKGCISTENISENEALKLARDFPGLVGANLAAEVSTRQIYHWDRNSQDRAMGNTLPYHVVVYDYGVKTAILRLLVDRGCRLTVVPYDTTAEAVIALKPQGIVFSNGPGDPAVCHEAIAVIRQLQETSIPLFGICLGFQLLALANDAKTYKMKFGHHGANHPVLALEEKRVMITSQNHGFAVDAATLPSQLIVTHQSLFDKSLQGFQHVSKSLFAFQGHPEASPGPHDLFPLFDKFISSLSQSEQLCRSEVI